VAKLGTFGKVIVLSGRYLQLASRELERGFAVDVGEGVWQ
jgi:hypothetical protein